MTRNLVVALALYKAFEQVNISPYLNEIYVLLITTIRRKIYLATHSRNWRTVEAFKAVSYGLAGDDEGPSHLARSNLVTLAESLPEDQRVAITRSTVPSLLERLNPLGRMRAWLDPPKPSATLATRRRYSAFDRKVAAKVRLALGGAVPGSTPDNRAMVYVAITRVFKEPEYADLRETDKLAHLPKIAALVHTPTVGDLETAAMLAAPEHQMLTDFVVGRD
jgi:hypothetical protein